MFNNDFSYATTRIQGTYMYNTVLGHLVYINDMSPDGGSNKLDRALISFQWNDLQGFHTGRGAIQDFRFQLGRFGYVNPVQGPTKFLSRVPLRREYRQGLRSSQLVFSRANSTASITSEWLSDNIINVSNTLNRVFPNNIEELFNDVEEKGVAKAFSRTFALTTTFKIAYRGVIVGKVDKSDKFQLTPRFGFLAEELEKEVGVEKIAR